MALASIYAARSSVICDFRLSDADPGSRRLLIGGQSRPLGRPHRTPAPRLARGPAGQMARDRQPLHVHQRPHRTGHRDGQQNLAHRHPARPRRDRRGPAHRPPVPGSLATRADPLHLAVTFGLNPGTAVRYSSRVRSLLQTAAEQQDPAAFPANLTTRPTQES